jgi:hypothetical protein
MGGKSRICTVTAVFGSYPWKPPCLAGTALRMKCTLLPHNQQLAPIFGVADCSRPAPDSPAGLAGASPEPRRSTSDPRSEVLRRGSGEAPGRLATNPHEWAGRAARVRGQRLAFSGTPSWAGRVIRDSANRHRKRSEAPPGHVFVPGSAGRNHEAAWKASFGFRWRGGDKYCPSTS